MMQLQPKDGFDWNKVTWGRPDSVRSCLCSYCSAVIPEGAMPLIMWTNDSHAAQFCLACQKAWWGVMSFDDDEDDL